MHKKHQWQTIYLINKYDWIRWYINVLLTVVDILQFYIIWIISEQFSRRDLKPVAFPVMYKMNNVFLQMKIFSDRECNKIVIETLNENKSLQ